MFLRLFLICFGQFLLFFSSFVLAQERVDLRDKATQILRELPPIDFSKFGSNSVGEQKMLDNFASALGLKPEKGERLGFLHSTKIQLTGKTTYHLEQRYQGIPVWGERVTVTTSDGKKAERIGGHAIRKMMPDKAAIIAKLTAADALAKARKLAGVERSITSPLIAQDISRKVMYLDQKTGKSVLAYETSFSAILNGKAIRPVYMIDAWTGGVLLKYDNIQPFKGVGSTEGVGPGGNAKSGCYFYGKKKRPSFKVSQIGEGTCTLDSANVATWNCHHTKLQKCNIHKFPCRMNKDKAINGACAPLNDAHFFGQVIFDMYRDWYGIRPLKHKLHMVVHYGKNVENAFWNGKAMLFGDGGNRFYPLVSLDVASHEIGHGFTDQHSKLVYKGQSGGLNEAFSDMAGEAAEAYFAEKYLQKKGGMAIAAQRYYPNYENRASQETGEDSINNMLTGAGSGAFYGNQRQSFGSGYNSSDNLNEERIGALLTEENSHYGREQNSTASNGFSSPDKYNNSASRQYKAQKPMSQHKMPDFELGADIFKKKGQALRYMYNPPKDGVSIASAVKYHDDMDVHYSSGIFNKAFYLLANKPGWDTRKAFSVFLVANAAYWTPRENFLSAALKTLDAAKDLKLNVEDVKSVFREVKVFVNP